ncbi:serine/threonine protein kinase [Candidatus Moduliflexus flocculans]|uniref:Serine/threonine protein kinase n=1 Tax=Candidatus Moduliflexus flocculans TaxID=1499966 RepID=A0A081BRU5_9BACT|nr:serine/threonine protein kinase [Candidatus Moduliflexus flocculans]
MKVGARIYHIAAWITLFSALAVLSVSENAAAISLKVVVNPNVATLKLDDGPIIVSVKSQEKNLTYRWELSGPGRLQGQGPAVQYLLPAQLDAASASVVIAVTVTNQAGEERREQVEFAITAPPTPTPTKAPMPTSTPEPMPTATPTLPPTSSESFSLEDLEQAAEQEKRVRFEWEKKLQEMDAARAQVQAYEQQDISAALKIAAWQRFLAVFAANNPYTVQDDELRQFAQEKIRYWQAAPSVAPTIALEIAPTDAPMPMPTRSEIETWLAQANEYFEKTWFLTPENQNAFALYQKVLKRDPANAEAKTRIFDMMEQYRQKAEESAAEKPDRAEILYQRYLTIAMYARKQFQDQQLAREIAQVQEEMRQLKRPKTTPTATPAPTLIPTSKATAKPTNAQLAPTPQPATAWVDPILGMSFVWVPNGCFQMGSPPNEVGRDIDENPIHEVCLNGFWIGQYEVTQAQWRRVMGENPSFFAETPNGSGSSAYPVENISWDDTQEFLKKLNAAAQSAKTDGQAPVQFRLPTEAEWEYACRAGTQTAYYFGNDAAQLKEYAWYLENADGQTHQIGERRPNAWGIYDMHGNVWEWCADAWNETYIGHPTDGSARIANADEMRRVARGGALNNLPWFLRCADRHWDWRDNRNFARGVRIVRAP